MVIMLVYRVPNGLDFRPRQTDAILLHKCAKRHTRPCKRLTYAPPESHLHGRVESAVQPTFLSTSRKSFKIAGQGLPYICPWKRERSADHPCAYLCLNLGSTIGISILLYPSFWLAVLILTFHFPLSSPLFKMNNLFQAGDKDLLSNIWILAVFTYKIGL